MDSESKKLGEIPVTIFFNYFGWETALRGGFLLFRKRYIFALLKYFTMLKTLITPRTSTYTLAIPARYIGKEVEVLLYASDELLKHKKPNNKKPSDFFGTLSATEGEKFQEYIANSRTEWNRNI